jgi:hypothetical protein
MAHSHLSQEFVVVVERIITHCTREIERMWYVMTQKVRAGGETEGVR